MDAPNSTANTVAGADPLAGLTTEELRAANAAIAKAATTPRDALPASLAGGPPAARIGKSVMSSEPFSFTRMLGLVAGQLGAEAAKTEFQVMKAVRQTAYETKAMPTEFGSGVFYPSDLESLADDFVRSPAVVEMQEHLAVRKSQGVDLDEIRYYAKNGGSAIRKAAMSYLNDNVGGALVAPPEMGELIPLMRNKSAINRAGATQQALPPQGTWVAPRVVSATTGYARPENTAGTESNPNFGKVSMEAKKLMVLVRVPNELFRFATASTDAMLRQDMATTLALDYDYQCLYGPGNGQTKGIANYTGTNEVIDYAASTPAPKGLGANGNTLRPEDGFNMSAMVLDRNFEEESFKWIMRPVLKGNILGYRGDAVAVGDANAGFVQSLMRAFADGVAANSWCGFGVVTSAQIRNTVTKGTSTTCTELFGGVWQHFIQGLYGAAEFFTANQGDTMVAADQTVIRATLLADAVPRYPGAFIQYKQLLQRG